MHVIWKYVCHKNVIEKSDKKICVSYKNMYIITIHIYRKMYGIQKHICYIKICLSNKKKSIYQALHQPIPNYSCEKSTLIQKAGKVTSIFQFQE